MVSSTTSLFNTMFYFVNDFLNILKVPILYIELRQKTHAFKTFRQNMIVIPPNFEHFNRLFLLNEPPVINIKISIFGIQKVLFSSFSALVISG